MSGPDRENSNAEEAQRFVPLEAITRIENEKGRWVVYMNVQSWEPSEKSHPIKNKWNRIRDFSTEAEARVAATWYERSANRRIFRPLGF